MNAESESQEALRDFESRLAARDGVLFNPEFLSDLLGRMDQVGRSFALKRLLEWHGQEATSRTVRGLFDSLPPILLGHLIDPGTADFAELFWADDDLPASRWERREIFEEWQRQVVRR